MHRRLLTCALVAVAGCAPAGEESSSTATSTETETSGTTSEAQSKALYASFVPEVEAGAGPALLRMFNDTETELLSLTLDDGHEFTFYLVEPLAFTEYELTVSADMWEDAILSIHTQETCIRKPFADMTGPLSLLPGHAYSLHVSVESGFVGTIEEEPAPEPYIGVRAHVTDPAGSASPAPSELVLSLGGDPGGEVAFKTIFDEHPEPYVGVPAAALDVTKIRFVDRSGAAHEATSPLALEGSFGYTVYVAGEESEGAEVSLPLEILSP